MQQDVFELHNRACVVVHGCTHHFPTLPHMLLKGGGLKLQVGEEQVQHRGWERLWRLLV